MNALLQCSNSCCHFGSQIARQWASDCSSDILGKMLMIAGAHNRRAALRMRQRVSQNEFRS